MTILADVETISDEVEIRPLRIAVEEMEDAVDDCKLRVPTGSCGHMGACGTLKLSTGTVSGSSRG